MVDRQHACEVDDECHDRKLDDGRYVGTETNVGRLADDGRRSSHDVCGRETLRAKSGVDDQAALHDDDVSVEVEFFETLGQGRAGQGRAGQGSAVQSSAEQCRAVAPNRQELVSCA